MRTTGTALPQRGAPSRATGGQGTPENPCLARVATTAETGSLRTVRSHPGARAQAPGGVPLSLPAQRSPHPPLPSLKAGPPPLRWGPPVLCAQRVAGRVIGETPPRGRHRLRAQQPRGAQTPRRARHRRAAGRRAGSRRLRGQEPGAARAHRTRHPDRRGARTEEEARCSEGGRGACPRPRPGTMAPALLLVLCLLSGSQAR